MKRYSELTINGENRWEDVQAFGQAIRIESATSGRYSTLLLIQLYIHTVLRQAMNPGKVIHEIEALEGKGRASKTKPALPFKHAPLKGLWHKHYLADGLSTMARNLLNGLRKDGLPWVEERVREASEAGEERYITLEDVNAITHDAVIGNWQRRSQANELTGEWIIYASYEGQNYYLCLGQHDSGDEMLRANIDACIPEFPFLSQILTTRMEEQTPE